MAATTNMDDGESALRGVSTLIGSSAQLGHADTLNPAGASVSAFDDVDASGTPAETDMDMDRASSGDQDLDDEDDEEVDGGDLDAVGDDDDDDEAEASSSAASSRQSSSAPSSSAAPSLQRQKPAASAASKRRSNKLGLPEDFDADLYGLRRSVSLAPTELMTLWATRDVGFAHVLQNFA